jgi:hypothetical protein
VIEHHSQLRVARDELAQRRQVARQDQCVEHQAAIDHRLEGRRQVPAEHPLRVRDVLDHGPQTHELVVGRERGDRVGGVRGFEVGPADDARDEVVRVRELQQVARLGHGGGGLHEDRRADAGASQRRREIRR